MTFQEQEIFERMKAIGVFVQVHARIRSGRHTCIYCNGDALLSQPSLVNTATFFLSQQVRHDGIEVVVGPPMGGITIAFSMAGILGCSFALAERGIDGRLFFSQTFQEIVRGKRVLIVDDVITSGTSDQEVISLLLEVGAIPVKAAALISRKALSPISKRLGIPVVSLIKYPVRSWTKDTCPLCKKGIPVDPHYGHGPEN